MSTPIHLAEDNFDSTLKTTALPVLVDFWATWCNPCKMIAPLIDEIAKELEGKALIAKVNIEENPKLVEQFSLRSVPTFLFIKDGVVKDSLVGLPSKKTITEKLLAL